MVRQGWQKERQPEEKFQQSLHRQIRPSDEPGEEAPTKSAIACRVIANVKVLVIAFMMPGVLKTLTHPSKPQTMVGRGGRFENCLGSSTPAASAQETRRRAAGSVIGSDGGENSAPAAAPFCRKTLRSDPSFATFRSFLDLNWCSTQARRSLQSSFAAPRIIHIGLNTFVCQFGLIGASNFRSSSVYSMRVPPCLTEVYTPARIAATLIPNGNF